MLRHGVSHGGATLVAILSSGLLVGHLHRYLPELAAINENLSIEINERVRWLNGVEQTSEILLAISLASIWKLAFAVLERKRH